jgi:hypothetical protein
MFPGPYGAVWQLDRLVPKGIGNDRVAGTRLYFGREFPYHVRWPRSAPGRDPEVVALSICAVLSCCEAETRRHAEISSSHCD